MPDDLRRVSVHTCGDQPAATVDLALPSGLPVGQLISSIVEIVRDESDVTPRRWLLSHVGGRLLDESMTLAENNIHDGELLVLSTIDMPEPVFRGEWLTDAAGVDPGAHPTGNVDVAACLWAVAVGAVALAWASAHAGLAHVVIAATLAAATGMAAAVTQRSRPDPQRCATLNVAAVLLAAAVGFAAVPAGPAAANFLLAAAAAASMSVLLLRATGCGTVWLTAATAFSTTTAVAVAVAAVWTLPTQATGALLATAALGVLGVAARLSILAAGLAPPMPIGDDRVEIDDDRAARGHRVLTGLVAGSAASVVVGALLVVTGCLHAEAPWPTGAAFTALVGVVLMLRARSHANGHCRIALIVGGIISATGAFVIAVAAMPAHAGWAGVVSVGAGLAALAPAPGQRVSPVTRRAVDLLEYLALAAVVPLACWVADVYGLVRGLSLT
jgi:type VII secretion integral membrane protein EccD